LTHYARALLARFENPAIRHQTWQIAMDGSQKLPQRLLATIRRRLERGLPCQRLCLVVAAWMIYVGGVNEKGEAIDVRDPLAVQLRSALQDTGRDVTARVDALLGFEMIFGPDLRWNLTFRSQVIDAYTLLQRVGARGAVLALNGR
jgi:fructuronate reductase